jgi:hypothetical protein
VANTKLFFGYPSAPALLRETVANGAAAVDSVDGVSVRSWEDLRVGGKVIVDQVLTAIDAADVCVFEVSDLNQNVLFELGYAIGSNKPVWPLLDASEAATKGRWERLGLLSSVGYIPYENSDDIKAAFFRERPDMATSALFEQSVEPILEPGGSPALLYLAGAAENEAGRALRRVVDGEERKGMRCIVADPSESSGSAADLVRAAHLRCPRRRYSLQ